MKNITNLLLTILVFGCSDNDDKTTIEDNGQWIILFKETMISDPDPVYKTEKLLFGNERLIQHSVKRQYSENEIIHEVNLTCFDSLVIVSTEGLTLVNTLNADGYASHCVYESPTQNRIYRFSYSIDCYLTDIIESIDYTEFSSASLAYESVNITSLNGIKSKLRYEIREGSSDYHLTCLGLLELHFFTLHIESLYAGLLGKNPRHITIYSVPKEDKYNIRSALTILILLIKIEVLLK